MAASSSSSSPSSSSLHTAPWRKLAPVAALIFLAACGHSQPDKDYGSSSGSGGPPVSGGKGGKGGSGGAGASCGGASGSGGCTTSGGGGDGTFSTDASCKALEKRFDELLPKVLACTVGTTKCDAKFRDRLACGCDLFIATEDFEGVALIQGVINDWDSAKCALKITCPDSACPGIVAGSCSANGDTGVCTTK